MLVRSSLSVFDAAEAAFLPVVFRLFRCDSALPAADFDFLLVDLPLRVFEAAFPARRPVFLLCAMPVSLPDTNSAAANADAGEIS